MRKALLILMIIMTIALTSCSTVKNVGVGAGKGALHVADWTTTKIGHAFRDSKILKKIGHTISAPGRKREARRLAYLNARFTPEEVDMIIHNRIEIGMSDRVFLEGHGRPDKINTSVYSSGTKHEQWVYNDYKGWPEKYFYFDNGILTGYQY